MLPGFPDVKEIAECVKSHEDRIALQQETLDRWMGLHEKLADLVFRQQEEVAKLKDEVFQLKAKLSIQQKKR
jgi:predicted  nucleic acid-binding Zn-ribbon protein